jgi:hypothetical protein
VILEILYASFHPSEFKNALGEWDFWIGTDVDNEFRKWEGWKESVEKDVETCAGLPLVIIEKVRMEGTVNR